MRKQKAISKKQYVAQRMQPNFIARGVNAEDAWDAKKSQRGRTKIKENFIGNNFRRCAVFFHAI